MKQPVWEKRIPTLLALIFIVIGVVLTSFLVKTGVIFKGGAAPSSTPENLRITNVSDTSFTVSFTTEENVIGTISFGKDKNLENNSIDDRDQLTGNVKPYKLHHITLNNLNPSTKYYFSIVSGRDSFLNNGAPYEVTTANIISEQPPSQQPAIGKIILPNGTKPEEAIVYIKTLKAQELSTLVKDNGSYILPLNSIRTKDLSSYFVFSDNDILEMLTIGQSFGSKASLLIKQINPIPTLTLSQNYDFTLSPLPVDLGFAVTASESSKSSGFPILPVTTVSSTNEPGIQTPKKDEGLTDPQPVFRGTALPGEDIKIVIHSTDDIQAQIMADNNGRWTYRPKIPLSPGLHTITITTKDRFGILRSITQSFTVFASGTQVVQSATPSATPTITITLTPTQTPTTAPTAVPTITSTPTPIPTILVTPTPTITVAPTVIPPTPIITQPPPVNPPPAPGSSTLIIVGIMGTLTTIAGILLFLASRGNIAL